MKSSLSGFEKRLLNILQTGLPLVERPYARIAEIQGSSEKRVLDKTRELVERGLIRRIGVVVNWLAVGRASTLVAACVPERQLEEVVAAVNGLKGVSHNYLRRHNYNLWFTLRAGSQSEIKTILAELSKRFGPEFHSLPVRRVFKLDVRFDAQSNGRRLLPAKHRALSGERRRSKLNAIDKRILERLESDLEVVARPFDFFDDEFENSDCLLHIAEMIERGVIYRIGAVVNHNKLGFTANAMFVCGVSEAKAVKVGRELAKLNIVSHCYQRRTFADWPYNLYGMMHGRGHKDIRQSAERFVRRHEIEKWDLLATEKRVSGLRKGHEKS